MCIEFLRKGNIQDNLDTKMSTIWEVKVRLQYWEKWVSSIAFWAASASVLLMCKMRKLMTASKGSWSLSMKVTCRALCTGASMFAMWQWRQWDQFCGVSCFSTGKRLGEGWDNRHCSFGVEGRKCANQGFGLKQILFLTFLLCSLSLYSFMDSIYIPWWIPKLNVQLTFLCWADASYLLHILTWMPSSCSLQRKRNYILS